MISGTGSRLCGVAAGYTLIEVLVATVILFGGLAAVLGAYSSAVTALDRATDQLSATQLLAQQAAEFEWAMATDGRFPAAKAGSGTGWLSRYDWALAARHIQMGPGIDGVEATVSVRRRGDATARTLVVRRTLLPPSGKDLP